MSSEYRIIELINNKINLNGHITFYRIIIKQFTIHYCYILMVIIHFELKWDTRWEYCRGLQNVIIWMDEIISEFYLLIYTFQTIFLNDIELFIMHKQKNTLKDCMFCLVCIWEIHISNRHMYIRWFWKLYL